MSSPGRAPLFRYAEYERFLLHARDRCRVTSLAGWAGGAGLILRHDVDLDVRAAHRLAILERRCDVSASYLFLTTAASYNPLSAESRRLIGEIARLGFDVGLHFDPTIYADATEDGLARAARAEAALIESVSGKPVVSVSIHNPSVHGRYPEFEGFRNAYDRAIFAPDRYLSDSRMNLRRDVYDFVAQATREPVQLLLHPLHFTPTGAGYDGIFVDFTLSELRDLDRTFRQNSTYEAEVKPDLLDCLRARLELDRGRSAEGERGP